MLILIEQKNVYTQWLKEKKQATKGFISSMKDEILRNLKLVFTTKNFEDDEWPVMNALGWSIRDFGRKNKLKEQDVFTEVKEYALSKFKNANLDLIELQENTVMDNENSKQNDPYYQFKSIYKREKCEYIDYINWHIIDNLITLPKFLNYFYFAIKKIQILNYCNRNV